MNAMGDNSIDNADALHTGFDRIIELERRKRMLADDISVVYANMKSQGFDVAALKLVVKAAMETEEKRKKDEGKYAAAHVLAAPLQIALPF